MIGRLSNGLFVFAVNAYIVRSVDQVETSKFFLISSALWLLVTVALWGTNHSIYTAQLDERTPQERLRRTAGFLTVTIPIAVIFGLPALGFLKIVDLTQIPLLVELTLSLALMTINGLLTEYARLIERLRWAFFAPAATQLIWLILFFLQRHFSAQSPTLTTIFATQWIAHATVVAGGFYFLFEKKFTRPTFEGKVAFGRRQIAFLLINVALFFVAQMDLWLAHILALPAQVAQYGVALRFMAVVTLPMGAIQMAFISDFNHAPEDLVKRRKIRALNRLSFFATLGAALSVVGLAAVVIPLFFGDKYRESLPLLSILAGGLTLHSLGGSCGYLLLLNNCMMSFLSSLFISSAFAILVSTFLFPSLGIMAIAMGSASGIILQTVINVTSVHIRLKLNWYDLLRP